MRNDPIQNPGSAREERPEKSLVVHAISSEKLLQGRRELQIMHGDEIYRLTLTRSGKLILHK